MSDSLYSVATRATGERDVDQRRLALLQTRPTQDRELDFLARRTAAFDVAHGSLPADESSGHFNLALQAKYRRGMTVSAAADSPTPLGEALHGRWLSSWSSARGPKRWTGSARGTSGT